ncbi:hypothetical protein OKW76_11810 [Sphingomonas sp. S1-29]|uniref:hypothetical protein n=1 Tax=Sphingomonas sp. S1-29 TaxID=2991074 RepID=UPI00224077B3|nr:hypothetical protein [Sphingomonas sp. S1-29]UZK68722.1 hypothetical protein OKW76_11810 [Sphingomonas sp. S1-29]
MVYEVGARARREIGPSVADDMAAILGTEIQVAPQASAAALPDEARGRSHGWKVAIAATLLITTVGAGVLVGKTTLDVPEQVAASDRTIARQQIGQLARNRPADTAASGDTGATATLVADSSGAELPADPEASPPAVQPSVADQPLAVADAPPAKPPTSVRRAPYRLAPDLVTAPAAPLADRPACDDRNGACMASRVAAAEQALVEAFDRADAAGVRQRTLRAYGRDWDRAADEAATSPDDALRLYREITLDVRRLADDAVARDRVRQR